MREVVQRQISGKTSFGPEDEERPEFPKATLVNTLFGFHDTLGPLNECIEAVLPRLNEEQRHELRTALMNGPQFLNTASELSLAYSLIRAGWNVELYRAIPGGGDVDVFASVPHEARFIEVTNVQSEELEACYGGFGPLPTLDRVRQRRNSSHKPPTRTDAERLVHNVKRKVDTKFGKALREGWEGPSWIALDYGKAHPISMAGAFYSMLGHQDWAKPLAESVFSDVPTLHGVLYYESSIGIAEAQNLQWYRNLRLYA